MSGLVAASPSTDTTAPSATIASPAAGRGDRRRRAGDGLRHRHRRGRHGGRRRGLDRRRHDVASGDRDDLVVATAGTRTARRARTIKARAVDDSGNLESAAAERHRQRRLPVHDGRPERDAVRSSTSRTPARSSSGVRVQGRPRRHDHRRALLQGDRRTPGTHVGNLWTTSGTLLARGTFSGETRVGLAAADVRDARGHHRGDDLRRVLLRAARATTRRRSAYFYLPGPAGGELARQPAAARRSARTAAAPTASTPTRSRRRSRPRRSTARTTAVDVSVRAEAAAGPGRHVTATAGPGSATVSFIGAGARAARRRATSSRRSSARPRRRRSPSRAPRRRRRSGSAASIPATSYTFKVQAANGSGTGPLSAASNAVTPLPPTAPGAPTGVIASGRQPARRRCAGRRRTTAGARSPATRSRRTSAASRSPRPR